MGIAAKGEAAGTSSSTHSNCMICWSQQGLAGMPPSGRWKLEWYISGLRLALYLTSSIPAQAYLWCRFYKTCADLYLLFQDLADILHVSYLLTRAGTGSTAA